MAQHMDYYHSKQATHSDAHSVLLPELICEHLFLCQAMLSRYGTGPGAWRPSDEEAQAMPSFVTAISSTPAAAAPASAAAAPSDQVCCTPTSKQYSSLHACLHLWSLSSKPSIHLCSFAACMPFLHVPTCIQAHLHCSCSC